MRPQKKHDRAEFFKYMSASTAKAVLSNRSFRWSSPILFNDPFDVPRESAFGVSLGDIQEAADRYWIHLLQNPPPDYDRYSDALAFAVKAVQGPHRFRVVSKLIGKSIAEKKAVSQKTRDAFEEIKRAWRATLPRLRILCLTENPSRMSMWYHYADKYEGVVVEVGCSESNDSPWLVAKQIQYPVDTPEILTPMGWAKILTLKPDFAIEEMLDGYLLNKTEDWSYEQEWRVYTFAKDRESGLFTDYKVAETDLRRVILGPNVSDRDKNEIRDLLKGSLSHVKLQQATFQLDRTISFSDIYPKV